MLSWIDVSSPILIDTTFWGYNLKVAMKECRAILGKIVNTVGLKGEVKLLPGPDFWEGALGLDTLKLVSAAGVSRSVVIEGYRYKGNTLVMKFGDISSIDEARVLVGSSLEADISSVGQVDMPEEILPCQVIGLEVRLKDGSSIGTVSDILLGSQQNCLIVRQGEESFLIPLVREIVVRVEPQEGFIEIDPPDGLLDLSWQ